MNFFRKSRILHFEMEEKAKPLYEAFLNRDTCINAPGRRDMHDRDSSAGMPWSNENAFAELVELITPRFVGMFRHLGADEHLARDCCQELFIALYRRAETYNQNMPFMPWAYSIARNIYLKTVQKRNKFNIVYLHPDIPGQNGIQAEDELSIQSLLARLSPEKRMIFELKHFQELKFKEVAEITGLPVGTVKSRMFHALLELREMLNAQ